MHVSKTILTKFSSDNSVAVGGPDKLARGVAENKGEIDCSTELSQSQAAEDGFMSSAFKRIDADFRMVFTWRKPVHELAYSQRNVVKAVREIVISNNLSVKSVIQEFQIYGRLEHIVSSVCVNEYVHKSTMTLLHEKKLVQNKIDFGDMQHHAFAVISTFGLDKSGIFFSWCQKGRTKRPFFSMENFAIHKDCLKAAEQALQVLETLKITQQCNSCGEVIVL